MPKVKTEFTPPPIPYRWLSIEEAPRDRHIFVTDEPDDPEGHGILVCWRLSRRKVHGVKGWQPYEGWFNLLNKRAIDFEPTSYRETVLEAIAA